MHMDSGGRQRLDSAEPADLLGQGQGMVSYRVGPCLAFSRGGQVNHSDQALTVSQAALLFANDR